jgi:phospholipase C
MRRVAVVLIVGCSSSHPAPACAPAQSCRTTCAFGAGDLAGATLADFTKLGRAIPIDHVVLVMQENRTFDHYFSTLTVPGQNVDGAANDTNPDPTGASPAIARFHQTAYCFDNPAESWNEVHRELDGGALDGFTAQNTSANDPTGARAMGYYDETDLPYYYALARAFATSDRHFASVLANSWTNRSFYMAATAYGITTNTFPPQKDAAGNILPNLFTRLNDAKVTWNFYAQDFPSIGILDETYAKNIAHVQPFQQFFDDAAAGQLASVSFVEGSDMLGGLSPDEDPPADMQVGEAMVASIIAALTSSPQWANSALFLSFDEQGGFYDHVVPPAACAPDDTPPMLSPGDVQAGYDQYGLRVPLIVVSPYAKRGYVSHVVTDHTSLLRFVEARFELPALSHRDANAVPPFDMFDFDHPDTSVPALPDAAVDAPQRAACARKYPHK